MRGRKPTRYYTCQNVAEILKIDRATARRWALTARIPALLIPGPKNQTIRIPIAEFERWLNRETADQAKIRRAG